MTDLVQIQNKQVVTTSLKVAEAFGKEHRHVLESIREILVAEKSAAKWFYETTYVKHLKFSKIWQQEY